MGNGKTAGFVFYAGRIEIGMMFKISKKLQSLPAYLFLEMDKARRRARQEGRDIIDLGVGDPDQPTPCHIIEALYQAALDPLNHRYALDQGMPRLRQAIASWYKGRFNVKLDSETEILPLIGSKEGIAHFPLCVLNNGDYSLVPDPCYPPYKGGTILAGGRPYLMPLLESNDFLPDLKKIPVNIRKKSKLMFINYPNNPTSATAGKSFYDDVVNFCAKNNIIVASDLAYSEIAFGAYRPMSFLELKGAKERGIEFHSLSKTYNMTGWRIGWACGNREMISALAKVKSNIDSGIFSVLQLAAITALEGPQEHIENMRSLYQRRRDSLVSGLVSLGWQVNIPTATFYLWIKTPKKKSSIDFCQMLLNKADIVVTPGVGFGRNAEGYIRMALTVSEERLKEAVSRLKKLF